MIRRINGKRVVMKVTVYFLHAKVLFLCRKKTIVKWSARKHSRNILIGVAFCS